MSFFDEINGCFSEQGLPLNPPFRAVLFGDLAIYVENVKTIAKYQCDEVILCLKNGGLIIRGKELCLKKYCAGDVAVCGKICTIERV
jgi:sporulation protein YqfC